MKQIWKVIKYIINHKTNSLVEITAHSPDLHYELSLIYRIHRVFGIPVKIFEKRFSNLGNGMIDKQEYIYNNDCKKLLKNDTII